MASVVAVAADGARLVAMGAAVASNDGDGEVGGIGGANGSLCVAHSSQECDTPGTSINGYTQAVASLLGGGVALLPMLAERCALDEPPHIRPPHTTKSIYAYDQPR